MFLEEDRDCVGARVSAADLWSCSAQHIAEHVGLVAAPLQGPRRGSTGHGRRPLTRWPNIGAMSDNLPLMAVLAPRTVPCRNLKKEGILKVEGEKETEPENRAGFREVVKGYDQTKSQLLW